MDKRASSKNKMLFASLTAFTAAVILLVLTTDAGGAGLRFGLFVSIYLTIAFVFMSRYKGLGSLDLFGPAPGLVVLLFLYSVASALYVESVGTTNYGDSVNASVMTTYYISCILGLAGISGGMLVAQRCRHRFDNAAIIRPFRIDNHTFARKLILYGIVVAIAFSPFIYESFDFSMVPSYAERALPLRVERMASATSGLSEFFLVILPITLILYMATLLMIRPRVIWVKLIGVAIFGAYISTNTLAGWRGVVISAATIPLVFYHYRVKRISKTKAAIVIVLAYLFINGLSVVRFTSDPKQMFDAMRNEILDQGFTFAKLKSSGELGVGTNLMRLIAGLEDGQTDFTYGSSVVTELLVFVPKAIYPNRPLPLSEEFVNVFYPQVHSAGGGYGFFMLEEGFWAFGLVGVFLFLFIYGWTVQVVYQWFKKNMQYDCVALLYSGIYFSLVLNSVRTGLISSYKTALMNILPFLLLAYLPPTKTKATTHPRQVDKNCSSIVQ
jgi:oligosaccharide repeat unit polymerase